MFCSNCGSSLLEAKFCPNCGSPQKVSEPAPIDSVQLPLDLAPPSKGYPFEVEVKTKEVTGVVLADQVTSLDWRARNAHSAGVVSAEVLAEVRSKLLTLVS
jgi:mRNA-degrading endonuclease toxin of MazEF toxin-antitoxin module